MVRHGRLLGITDEFLPHIATVGINLMQNNYPDLENNNDLFVSSGALDPGEIGLKIFEIINYLKLPDEVNNLSKNQFSILL